MMFLHELLSTYRRYIARFESTHRLHWNFLFNLAGRGSGTVINLLAIPIYVSLLGHEQYGLIGFAISLQAAVAVFDFGFGLTINREMAAHGSEIDGGSNRRSILSNIEIKYWGLSLLAASLIWFGSDFIALHWLRSTTSASANTAESVRLAAVWILFQFPYSIYHGALSGMGKQLTLNIILFVVNTARPVLSIAMLLIFGAKIWPFLAAQIAASICQTMTLRFATWRHILNSAQQAYPRQAIKGRPAFINSLAVVSICWLLLSSIDRLLLAHFLDIENYAVYTIVFSIAILPASLAGPLNISLLPLLSDLVARKQPALVAEQIGRAVLLTVQWILPLSLLLAVFPKEALRLWTADRVIAEKGAPILAILSLGYFFYIFLTVPFALLIAMRKTKVFALQCVATVVLSSLTIVCTATYWGALAGAVSLTLAYLCLMLCAISSIDMFDSIDSKLRREIRFCFLHAAIGIVVVAGIRMCLNIEHRQQTAIVLGLAAAAAYGPAIIKSLKSKGLKS
jgi:O-antigen/teichoic acid export membrane protein